MAIATLDKSAAQWIGWDLRIDADHLELPAGCSLPAYLWLHGVHVQSSRGVMLGQRWYLGSPRLESGHTVDLISPVEIEGSYEVCKKFLTLYGYAVRGKEYPAAMEYVRVA